MIERPEPISEAAEPAPKRRIRLTFWNIAIGIALLGIVVMWTYAFFFAPTNSLERIPDRGWVTRSEATCKVYRDKIYALPHARSFKDVTPRSEALRQRADVADQASGYIRDMLQVLHADTPSDAHSVVLTTTWLKDWDVYMGDRDAHIAQFRAGQDPPFAQTANEQGAPGPIRMDQFSRTNGMADCQVPLDLG